MKLIFRKAFISILRIIKTIHLKLYIKFSSEIKIIVGAANTKLNGWFSTNEYLFNLIKETDYKKFFSDKNIDKVLIEHVLEHLSEPELDSAIQLLFKYTSNDCNIRIAVPDGFHKNPNYIDYVRPCGTGSGASEHKFLFNYKTLSVAFNKVGFRGNLLEYWDENGNFHSNYTNDKLGFISRSFLNDDRNINGLPNYTSIIIDFTKYDSIN